MKRNNSARKIQNFYLSKLYAKASNSKKTKRFLSYVMYDAVVKRSKQEKREILKLRKYVMRLAHTRTIYDSLKFFAQPYRSFSEIMS